MSSSSPVISATLRGARGNICALRAAQIALIAGVVAWETLPRVATATPVCKHEWLCFICARWLQRNGQVLTWKEKVVILDKLKLLKRGPSQRSAAEQLDIIRFGCFARYSWHFEDELGPTGFISHFGPVRGVDDITGFYCIGLFFGVSHDLWVLLWSGSREFFFHGTWWRRRLEVHERRVAVGGEDAGHDDGDQHPKHATAPSIRPERKKGRKFNLFFYIRRKEPAKQYKWSDYLSRRKRSNRFDVDAESDATSSVHRRNDFIAIRPWKNVNLKQRIGVKTAVIEIERQWGPTMRMMGCRSPLKTAKATNLGDMAAWNVLERRPERRRRFMASAPADGPAAESRRGHCFVHSSNTRHPI